MHCNTKNRAINHSHCVVQADHELILHLFVDGQPLVIGSERSGRVVLLGPNYRHPHVQAFFVQMASRDEDSSRICNLRS
jgi:hypothetical protein